MRLQMPRATDIIISLLSLHVWFVNCHSPPGKPTISCQSSGNETFTCWWKPDPYGGQPTNYFLLYNIEGEEQTRECPDYVSAGPNSCYFDQSFTSLWKTYNITVKATNDVGVNISDLHYVDIRTLVKPDLPMDLSLEVKQLNGITYIEAKWSPPLHVVDATSWLACNYEVRMKPAGEEEWQTHFVGKQTFYKTSQLGPGTKYIFQVRCIRDHGEKSKWSPERYIQLRSGQPPGKPEILRCRSPEKETFTCWWKPGSDGGLPTNYTLLYNKEGERRYYECPDYTTAGPNSCYFDKKHTSLWITYNFTVKAINEMGSTVSDPYYVDVANIVQPDPPENLSLQFEKKVYGEYLLLNWDPPSLGDVKSGWLTLEYELHIKPEEGQEWEKIFVGQRTTYKMFSVNPGERYIAQVRCRSDHGSWSEWSPQSFIKLQKEVRLKDILVWIFVACLSFAVCLILIWTLALKRTNMVARILPPVPGPKIKGFDTQLLEAGKTEELLSALDSQGFLPTSDYDDLLVEFLEIDESEDQQLMPSCQKCHPNKKSHHETDSDSGRGSCESPSLLSEKRKDTRNLVELKMPDTKEMQMNSGIKSAQEVPETDFEGPVSWLSSGGPRASTWPGVLLLNCPTPKCSYCDNTGVRKMALSASNIKTSPPLMGREEKSLHLQLPTPTETVHKGVPTQLEDAAKFPQSVLNDQGTSWPLPPDRALPLSTKLMDYVEVHKVSPEGALAVLPKQKEKEGKTEKHLVPGDTNEYTRVSTVVANHILVLFPDPKNEALPPFQEPPKEAAQNSQPHQPEKNWSYCFTAPSSSKIQSGGLDYMDPNNFMPTLN
uniref:Prolactin receptor n=1 Tax=Pogona vitticeps TaxID=103695 RepID=A0A6J0TS31_9SAUR